MADRSGQGIELSSRQSEDPGLHVYTPSTATTPTPLYPYPSDDPTKSSLPWEKTSYTHHPQQYSPNFHDHHRPLIPPPETPVPPKPSGSGTEEPRILGLKRRVFFILLASLVIVLVIGVATGVGVGVAMNGQDPPKTTTTPTPTSPATTTRLLPIPLATATTSPTDLIQCPSANLTLYASRVDLAKRFLVLCGRDYNSNEGSHDLLSRDAETMGECIDDCAGTGGCVGAGWGYSQGRYVCWLKSRLGEGRGAGGWCFAVLDSEG